MDKIKRTKPFKVHHASIDLNGQDIPTYEFNDITHVYDWAHQEIDKLNCVYLLSIEDEIFISENPVALYSFITSMACELTMRKHDLHIQEYRSYEAAYEVALYMKEPNPLCYE